MDGKEGKNFNLILVPIDIQVDKHSFALDYHISIYFELENRKFNRDKVFEMTHESLKKMKIEVEDVLEEFIPI